MVGIIYISDLRGCPFIQRYIDALEEKNEDYKILIWNRESKVTGINRSNKLVEFSFYQDTRNSKFAKVDGFLRYSKFLHHEIKKNRFDKLIVLCTLTGVLIADLLLGKYRDKYIFDIRDASYEKFSLFKKIEQRLVNNSRFTTISSDGFLSILPESNKYVFCPNLRWEDICNASKAECSFRKKKRGDKLNFVYIGAVRQYDNVKKIVDAFAHDERFEVYFHGAGDEGYHDMVEYVEENQYTNIHFTGRYSNDQKMVLLEKADILNNFYASTYDMRYANTNKYLDAVIYHIPLVSNLETHDGTKSVEEQIGISYLNVISPDSLYEDYFSIDEVIFNEACANALRRNITYDKIVTKKIREFLEN